MMMSPKMAGGFSRNRGSRRDAPETTNALFFTSDYGVVTFGDVRTRDRLRSRVYSPLPYSTFATFLLHLCPVLGHSISSHDAATMSSPVNGDLARTTPSSFAAVVR